MKIKRTRTLLIFLALLGQSLAAMPQATNFSGTWKLKDRIFISGNHYSNGVPEYVIIKQSLDSVTIKASFLGGDKAEIVTETLAVTGKPLIEVNKSDKRKVAMIVWDHDKKELQRVSTYSIPGSYDIVEYRRYDKLLLTSDGLLKMSRSYLAERDSSQNWSMRGTYVKVTDEELRRYSIGEGILFETELNWQAILAKAKKNHKFIFVDCYATWCGPCKTMDKTVYPVDTVGRFVNSNYISIKLQLDTTKNDDLSIVKLRQVAHDFAIKYNITSLPSYLIFSQEGEILNKGMGSKDVDDFVDFMISSMSPENQIYTVLRKWRAGKLQSEKLPELAYKMKDYFGEPSIAGEIAKDYITNHLESANEEVFLRKSNIEFIGSFSRYLTPANRIVRLCLKSPNKVNGVMSNGNYAQFIIDDVVYFTYISDRLVSAYRNNTEPNWKRIEYEIGRSFPIDVLKRNMIDAKTEYFRVTKQWTKYASYVCEQIRNKGVENELSSLSANHRAWMIFLHSSIKSELETALCLANKGLSLAKTTDSVMGKTTYVGILDTKANILYKLGKVNDAILVYEEVIAARPGIVRYKETLDKIKRGEPTWPTLN